MLSSVNLSRAVAVRDKAELNITAGNPYMVRDKAELNITAGNPYMVQHECFS